jgi:serine/threonine protein kinase
MLEDGIERVKITDFGLALTILDVTRLTSVGLAVGTPAYMSPEQVNSRPVGPPSDLFSLGAVLYTMATGRSPFHAAHPIEVGRKVSEYNPPPLHEVAPTVPRFLSDVVARLLAKKPEDRYPSATAIVAAIDDALASAAA